jgi:hypothetical protein
MSILEPFNHIHFSVTQKILIDMGFAQTHEFGGIVYQKEFNGITALVTIMSDGTWRPQLMMNTDEEDVFIFYDIQNIKDLTDLKDFISYL